jgi:hypothetical protein
VRWSLTPKAINRTAQAVVKPRCLTGKRFKILTGIFSWLLSQGFSRQNNELLRPNSGGRGMHELNRAGLFVRALFYFPAIEFRRLSWRPFQPFLWLKHRFAGFNVKDPRTDPHAEPSMSRRN